MFIDIDIEKIKNHVLKGESIESVLSRFDWRGFESAISKIFAANGYWVSTNVRFKTDRRYEIDIVASKHGTVFCVDCKNWGTGRYKSSGLRKAADIQAVRTIEFERFVSNNPIAKHKLKIREKSNFYPALVTLFEEYVTIDNEYAIYDDEYAIYDDNGPVNAFIAPVWKLNSFLNHF